MSGIGVLLRPLPGWLDWIATLSASPEEVCLDLRGIGADDPESTRLATSPPGLTLLTSQCQWVEWSRHADGLGHRLVVELSEVSSLPAKLSPTSVHQLQQLAEQSAHVSELWLLPGDISGGPASPLHCTRSSCVALLPECRLVLVSSAGPAVVATLLRNGIDTVLLSDQLMLLSDYLCPSDNDS